VARLRHELLNAELFANLREAKVLVSCSSPCPAVPWAGVGLLLRRNRPRITSSLRGSRSSFSSTPPSATAGSGLSWASAT